MYLGYSSGPSPVRLLVQAATEEPSGDVIGLTSDRFGVLVVGLALVVMCAAAVMVASWLR